jgi:hypothetical protein
MKARLPALLSGGVALAVAAAAVVLIVLYGSSLLVALSTFVAQGAHLIGMVLLVYALLAVVRGIGHPDAMMAIFRAIVAGVVAAALMRL